MLFDWCCGDGFFTSQKTRFLIETKNARDDVESIYTSTCHCFCSFRCCRKMAEIDLHYTPLTDFVLSIGALRIDPTFLFLAGNKNNIHQSQFTLAVCVCERSSVIHSMFA